MDRWLGGGESGSGRTGGRGAGREQQDAGDGEGCCCPTAHAKTLSQRLSDSSASRPGGRLAGILAGMCRHKLSRAGLATGPRSMSHWGGPEDTGGLEQETPTWPEQLNEVVC